MIPGDLRTDIKNKAVRAADRYDDMRWLKAFVKCFSVCISLMYKSS